MRVVRDVDEIDNPLSWFVGYRLPGSSSYQMGHRIVLVRPLPLQLENGRQAGGAGLDARPNLVTHSDLGVGAVAEGDLHTHANLIPRPATP